MILRCAVLPPQIPSLDGYFGAMRPPLCITYSCCALLHVSCIRTTCSASSTASTSTPCTLVPGRGAAICRYRLCLLLGVAVSADRTPTGGVVDDDEQHDVARQQQWRFSSTSMPSLWDREAVSATVSDALHVLFLTQMWSGSLWLSHRQRSRACCMSGRINSVYWSMTQSRQAMPQRLCM